MELLKAFDIKKALTVFVIAIMGLFLLMTTLPPKIPDKTVDAFNPKTGKTENFYIDDGNFITYGAIYCILVAFVAGYTALETKRKDVLTLFCDYTPKFMREFLSIPEAKDLNWQGDVAFSHKRERTTVFIRDNRGQLMGLKYQNPPTEQNALLDFVRVSNWSISAIKAFMAERETQSERLMNLGKQLAKGKGGITGEVVKKAVEKEEEGEEE